MPLSPQRAAEVQRTWCTESPAPISEDGVRVLIYPDTQMTSWVEEERTWAQKDSEFSKSEKPATRGSLSPSRLNTQAERDCSIWRHTSIVKGCSMWRDQSIVQRQAQDSPLHNRVGLPRKVLIFFADLDGVCTFASLEVSKAVSVWNTLLPAASSLAPSPSPVSLGHLSNFSPSHIQLRYLLYPEAFPDTPPSLPSSGHSL